MAVYIQDSMTDTNGTTLAAHTPTPTGGSYSLGTGGSVTIQSNQLVCNFFSANHTGNVTQASTADYDVSMDLIFSGVGSGSGYMGVLGRGDFSAANYYRAYYDLPAGQYKLSQISSAVVTTLGTFSSAYVQGQTHNVVLRMQGSTISLLVDGVVKISVTDTTFSAKGNPGIYTEDVFSQDIHGKAFLVQDIPSGVTNKGFFF